MFFYLSKIFWFFVSPGNAFLLALLAGLLLLSTRFARTGKFLVTMSVLFALLVTFVPIGPYMIRTLEHRFPVPETLPAHIDGIVVLGGVIDPIRTVSRGTLAIGGAVERITVSARLALEHPEAKLVYSGGSGTITQPNAKEADHVPGLYTSLGLQPGRLMLEREARNTWENAKFTMDMISPGTDEKWVLITSAFHMPRAVGVFRRVGWEMIPYPVDFESYTTLSFPSPLDFTSGLSGVAKAGHEWIGLFAYWLTGKNSAAFPKPRGSEAQ